MPFKRQTEGTVLLKDAVVRKLIAEGVPGDHRDSEKSGFLLRVYGPHKGALRWRFYHEGASRVLTRQFTHQPSLTRDSSLATPRVPVNVAGFRRLIELAERLKRENIDPLPPQESARRAGVAPLPCALDPAEAWHLEEVLGDAPVLIGTMAHVVRDYLLLHVYASMRRRSQTEADMIAKRILSSRTPLGASVDDARWRDRPAGSITRKDVLAALVDPLMREGKQQMARTLACWIGMILRWAERRDDAAYGITKVPDVKVKTSPSVRIDYIEAEDVGKFWRGLDRHEAKKPSAVAFLRIMLLLGQRPWHETAPMQWADIHGDWWTLRASVTKNKREHKVFLGPQAKEILEAQRARVGKLSRWVFPSAASEGKMPVTNSQARALYRTVLEDAGIIQPEPFGPHGLRRTMATLMEEAVEIPQQTIAACLNHTPQTVTGRHYLAGNNKKAKMEAWARWGAWVEEQVKGES